MNSATPKTKSKNLPLEKKKQSPTKMVEQEEAIIVYRRRPAEELTSKNSTKRHSSLEKKPVKKKQRCIEFEQGVGKRNLKVKTHTDQKTPNMNLEALQSELVDVILSVEASNRGEKVPFVCLTSESYGKPILGYPLEIGEVTETLLPSKESVARKLYGDKRSRVHQLVWRTSKRTPVCYVATSFSSPVSKNVEKKLKKSNQSETASSQTCVPVDVIFSKISSGTDFC